MKSLSIEQLAEKLGGKLWIKEDKKRIYLDRGYNTKKMSTKTYVYQREDGSFGVSCYIDCPSQDYNWIRSQQNEVIKGVEDDIEEAMVDTYYLVVEDATGEYIDNDGKKYELNFLGSNDRYLTEDAAQEFIENELGKGFSVKSMDRDEFDKEVERLDEIQRVKRAEEKANRPIEEKKPIKKEPSKVENTSTSQYGIGSKVNHGRFGIGEVMAESDTVLQVNFGGDLGLKSLIKKYAPFTKVESND